MSTIISITMSYVNPFLDHLIRITNYNFILLVVILLGLAGGFANGVRIIWDICVDLLYYFIKFVDWLNEKLGLE